jgi:hypothetical protein
VATDGAAAYELLDRELWDVARVATGFTQLLACEPRRVDATRWNTLQADGAIVEEFFRGVGRVFHESLAGSGPTLGQLLLADAPCHLDERFHRSLGSLATRPPGFYRTDESELGKIFEIQCPGSLWGDHLLVEFALRQSSRLQAHEHAHGLGLGRRVAELIRDRVATSSPAIHYLLDNASVASSARYFVGRTARDDGLRYLGLSPGVKGRECNYVRSHSVYGLAGENFFRDRIRMAKQGQLEYDLPPSLLFDQKLPLCFPFEPETRIEFRDCVRELLAFTSLVRPEGVRLPGSDRLVPTQDFARLPRRQRGYYLKYAGTDVSLNWGSRAVHSLRRLGREPCELLLRRAAEDLARGRPWIMQEAHEARQDVEWWERGGERNRATLDAKVSRFFGAGDLLGALQQHRPFYKVHGQSDTVVSLLIGEQVSRSGKRSD